MTQTPALPFLKRRTTRPRAVRTTPADLRVAWSSHAADPVDVVAPDSERAAVLLRYAAPLFPGEIVSGSEWIVRLQPAPEPGWVLELLSVIDRWLESTALPVTTVRYGGRSYPIRAYSDAPEYATAAPSAAAAG